MNIGLAPATVLPHGGAPVDASTPWDQLVRDHFAGVYRRAYRLTVTTMTPRTSRRRCSSGSSAT